MPDRAHVAKIVSAYAKRNALAADQLPALIATVHGTLAGIERGEALPEPASELAPAVPIRRSVQADAITCLDCGLKAKTLKKHLSIAHGMTPHEYRTRWSLPRDYLIVAPNYAARRSELAKSIGLGKSINRSKMDQP